MIYSTHAQKVCGFNLGAHSSVRIFHSVTLYQRNVTFGSESDTGSFIVIHVLIYAQGVSEWGCNMQMS